MKYLAAGTLAALVLVAVAASCGSRTDLSVGDGKRAGAGGSGGEGGAGGSGGEGGQLSCEPGEVLVCGLDVGECETGTRVCENGTFGECQGAINPVEELCNDLDDNCDGAIDEGFGLGQPCDGADSDQCLDDQMTCAGCTLGPDTLETCNGVDDNCNGVIDADCDMGDCQPALLVTNTTPSNPACINFPVMVGSSGSIQYPCTGGPVSATLGGIAFSGAVTDGNVFLTGTVQTTGPDNCQWQFDHIIQGQLASGTLSYSYAETLLDPPQNCWSPCTEQGSVDVQW